MGAGETFRGDRALPNKPREVVVDGRGGDWAAPNLAMSRVSTSATGMGYEDSPTPPSPDKWKRRESRRMGRSVDFSPPAACNIGAANGGVYRESAHLWRIRYGGAHFRRPNFPTFGGFPIDGSIRRFFTIRCLERGVGVNDSCLITLV